MTSMPALLLDHTLRLEMIQIFTERNEMSSDSESSEPEVIALFQAVCTLPRPFLKYSSISSSVFPFVSGRKMAVVRI